MVRALFLALLLVMPVTAQIQTWEQLPSVPDPEGFASPFAGVSGGALLLAGGANIPHDRWTDPVRKVWYDDVFVLPAPEQAWQRAGRLPCPIGYGVSITVDDAVLCLGGSDATHHFSSAFRLRWTDGGLQTSDLPPLPRPCANACGALVGRTIYLAGGLEQPAATTALHTFWALDLDSASPAWRELAPWPGPERMLAVAASFDGSFYLFSGAQLHPDADGKPVREYLRDAWRFTPGQGWERLPDIPRAAVAAASPAPVIDSAIALLSGDDGLNVTFQPMRNHPGFPRNALLFRPSENRWQTVDGLPFSRATVPAVRWRDRLVLLNGEARPRVRTPEVWSMRLR
jgi:N-acetylneuraminic acid mutarotase